MRSRAWPVALWGALLAVSLVPGLLPRLLAPLAGGTPPTLAKPLWALTLDHLGLVLLAEVVVLLLAVPLTVFVTRERNGAFLGLTETLVGLGQTVPTLAILALAVPTLGFGVAPTLLGLTLYGLVPVVSNGVAGLRGVDTGALDAARGMGMSGWQRLTRVEVPLALPVWLAGVRTSVVYNVGTATVGAALGAGGLGSPIINGLSEQNTALVLVGAVAAALLALTLDALLGLLVPAQ
ncbi:ABC transporter permease [Deinococcus maricopensis]|uniref:ABC-type transporter, integral membrane subunit n=1 Tax=Deinococcus maricopensis (strain DSM 21211 / LMG 22137 / NRRL B-23946 / LB-34) TaxID=709986 RepID=E8U6K2_DEIML|nr:ABC transporter permease subunit [Deinococcus maricopensis]ADV66691.1 ABC-type transporter, integral membrane subunit [Deinococcus maricopensis DSM 21211]